ncbi:MAG: hypothetical protein N3A61_01725 [Ignavibacteria bacterium]|nr:hypothetical protein [Ignavibacteria bacterium]
MAFTKFENRSNYAGAWKIEFDLPNVISSYIREKFELHTISASLLERELSSNYSDSISLSQVISNLNCKYLVTGKLNKFSISRFTAGEPKIAGYESYVNDISLQLTITDVVNQKIVWTDDFERSSSDLGFGITIFGRQTQSKREFDNLDNIKFGSSEFFETLVGKNVLKLCEEITSRSEELLKSIKNEKLLVNEQKSIQEVTANPFIKKIIRGELIIIDNDAKEVFLNLGSKDFIKVGDILNVYTFGDSIFNSKTNKFIGVADKKIGEIEIIEVRGESFSLGFIKSQTQPFIKGNEVRKLTILPR